MSEGSTRLTLPRNPFSHTAVAELSSSPAISVPTSAVRDALHYLDDYLGPAAAGVVPSRGKVIAILGDYGSGKTHLAALLVNQARAWQAAEPGDASEPRLVRPVSLDATGSIRELYRSFVERLPQQEVYSCVREYYGDIVRERLGGGELASRITLLLRDPAVDPSDVTTAFGLAQDDLLDALRARLRAVTKNEMFAAVLALMIRPGFREYAWDWLNGAAPHPLLTERNIGSPVRNQTAAIEAFSAFALFYAHRGHRLVVVVDELHRLLAGLDDTTAARKLPAAAACQQLLAAAGAAGAFLALVGLPESFEQLDHPIRQRIGTFIAMAPFDNDVTRAFVDESFRAAGQAQLAARFTDAAIAQIVTLAHGNPRKIALYCHRLYQRALLADPELAQVVGRDVREVAAGLGPERRPQVAAELPRILGQQGFTVIPDYHVASDRRAAVDYWVPFDGETGCAVFLAKSVTSRSEVNDLVRRAGIVQDLAADNGIQCELLLVVSEALVAKFVKRLCNAFGEEPLVYHPERFAADLAAVVKRMQYRLDRTTAAGDVVAALRDRIERMGNQQARAQQSVDQLMSGLREHHAASERRMAALDHGVGKLTGLVAALAAREDPGSRAATAASLPPKVATLFDSRLQDLAALGNPADVLAELFVVRGDRRVDPRRVGPVLSTIFTDRQSLNTAFAVSVVLNALVTVFRGSVDEWYRSSGAGRQHRPAEHELAGLQAICETYDAAFEYLPLIELDRFIEVTDQKKMLALTARLLQLREQFENLGVDIRRAVLDSFPS